MSHVELMVEWHFRDAVRPVVVALLLGRSRGCWDALMANCVQNVRSSFARASSPRTPTAGCVHPTVNGLQQGERNAQQ